MTDLSDYELRVLRQMATGGDADLICGAALWVALDVLRARGFLNREFEDEWTVSYSPTEAGRALVRARDAELTEAKNG